MMDRKSFQEQRYRFDESVFKPGPDTRMPLHGEMEVVYEEEQSFDQIWLWAILGIELLVVLIPLILTGQPWWTILLMVSIMGLTMAMMGSLKLYTRMDDEGVHFRMKLFHWKERTIPWDDIDQIFVRKYSPIKEYGGWGIRFGRNGKAFNVKGLYGVQIVKKDGSRILLGTQRPDEAAHFLGKHPLLV